MVCCQSVGSLPQWQERHDSLEFVGLMPGAAGIERLKADHRTACVTRNNQDNFVTNKSIQRGGQAVDLKLREIAHLNLPRDVAQADRFLV